jgi:hypothetical protein
MLQNAVSLTPIRRRNTQNQPEISGRGRGASAEYRRNTGGLLRAADFRLAEKRTYGNDNTCYLVICLFLLHWTLKKHHLAGASGQDQQ